MKDWTGNKASVHTMLGNDYKTKTETADREVHDFYATEPRAVRLLMEALQLPKEETFIWECACGEGHLGEELKDMGYQVYCSDLVQRQYNSHYESDKIDFLQTTRETMPLRLLCTHYPCIITNPPYKYTTEFILHALELLPQGGICAMLLNINYLSGIGRFNAIYKDMPPKAVYVFTGRVSLPGMAILSTAAAAPSIMVGLYGRKGVRLYHK